jgi:prepilin peptidase CpaA
LIGKQRVELPMPNPIAFIMLVLLLVVVWRDIATRTIPNVASVLICGIGGLTRLLQVGPSALALSAVTALLLFAVLLVGHARGLIGGGDVKVMAALGVGLSPFDCYQLVVATALAGGLLAGAYLLLSRKLRAKYKYKGTSLLNRVLVIETWRIRRRRPLPYGVAIAAGGAFALFHHWSF